MIALLLFWFFFSFRTVDAAMYQLIWLFLWLFLWLKNKSNPISQREHFSHILLTRLTLFKKNPTPREFPRKCLTCFLFSTSEPVRDLVLLPDYLPAGSTDLDFVPVFPSLWAWYFLLFQLCFVCLCFSSFYDFNSLLIALIFLIYSLLFVTLLIVSSQYILLSSCLNNITKLYELLWNTIHIHVISTLSPSLLYQSKKVRI